jgi:hypothetical protein
MTLVSITRKLTDIACAVALPITEVRKFLLAQLVAALFASLFTDLQFLLLLLLTHQLFFLRPCFNASVLIPKLIDGHEEFFPTEVLPVRVLDKPATTRSSLTS